MRSLFLYTLVFLVLSAASSFAMGTMPDKSRASPFFGLAPGKRGHISITNGTEAQADQDVVPYPAFFLSTLQETLPSDSVSNKTVSTKLLPKPQAVQPASPHNSTNTPVANQTLPAKNTQLTLPAQQLFPSSAVSNGSK